MKQNASEFEQQTDEALMLAYTRGSFPAFEFLYKRHKDAVYRYLLRHGITNSIAEELLQDIWSSIIGARESYQVSAQFTTWLYRIARNRLIDHCRSNKDFIHLVEDNSPASDDRRLNSAEQLTKIRHTVAKLPFPQRQALLLHYEAGLTVKEVADVTEEHPEAVKSSIRYAIKKLSRLLRTNDE